MKTVKTIVKTRMREMGWGPYDLAKAVRPHISPQTVYNFLSHGREMNSRSLAFVLDALGLEIREKR